jgi:small-conductance mechanosensitive channel
MTQERHFTPRVAYVILTFFRRLTYVFLLEYGDNVATFQLNVWLDNPVLRPKVTSDLKLKLWDAFAVNNIALPFPEIELHFPSRVALEMTHSVQQPALVAD